MSRRLSSGLSAVHALKIEQAPDKPSALRPQHTDVARFARGRWEGRETTVNSRTTGKTGCPYCAGKRPWSERNLAVVRPELTREWHPTRNGTLTPESLTPWSQRGSSRFRVKSGPVS